MRKEVICMISLLFALLLALVVAVFATFNQTAVDLYFFDWVLVQVPISIVIIASALIGALAGFLVTGLRRISDNSAANKELRKTKDDLKDTATREAQLAEDNKELRISRENALRDQERTVNEVAMLRRELDHKDQTIRELKEAVANVRQDDARVTTIETEDRQVTARSREDYQRADRESNHYPENQEIDHDQRRARLEDEQYTRTEDLPEEDPGRDLSESDQRNDLREETSRKKTVTKAYEPPKT
jgi:uncharacterized integral membrane protein